MLVRSYIAAFAFAWYQGLGKKFPVCKDYLANVFRNANLLYLTVTNLICPALTYG